MIKPAQIIRWENPPPTKAISVRRDSYPESRWTAVAAELAANPGRYAVVFESDDGEAARSIGQQIRAGRVRCFQPRGDYDACTRSVGGKYIVYACYCGDGRTCPDGQHFTLGGICQKCSVTPPPGPRPEMPDPWAATATHPTLEHS